MKGLSPSFVAGIEKGLGSEENPPLPEGENIQEDVKIPPQYEGLDAEALDELWIIPEYLDPEKTKQEKERREKVLAKLRSQEDQTNKEKAEIEELRKGLGLEEKEKEKTKEAEEVLGEEERKKLAPWPASYELAKIAKQRGMDLSKLSREEYADFAIQNKCPIGDDQLRVAPWQRMATSAKEIVDINKEMRENFSEETDMEFHKFVEETKEMAGTDNRNIEDNIRVRSGTKDSDSWLFFAINQGADRKSKETFKSYVSLQNLEKLNPARFQKFLATLRDGNYQGDVKIFQDMKNMGLKINDQIVMHGRSEEDAQLGLKIAEQFFGDELNQKSLGKDEVIDGKELSYSQILGKKITDSVRGEKNL